MNPLKGYSFYGNTPSSNGPTSPLQLERERVKPPSFASIAALITQMSRKIKIVNINFRHTVEETIDKAYKSYGSEFADYFELTAEEQEIAKFLNKELMKKQTFISLVTGSSKQVQIKSEIAANLFFTLDSSQENMSAILNLSWESLDSSDGLVSESLMTVHDYISWQEKAADGIFHGRGNEDLSHADFRFIDPGHALMNRYILDHVNWTGARLANTVLYETSCKKAIFNRVTMIKTDLDRANLTGASFINAELTAVGLFSSICNGANFTSATIIQTVFCAADLTDANFTDATLQWVDLRGANLTNATLKNVCLVGGRVDEETNFTNATVSLRLPEHWDHDSLDIYLNHLNNPKSGSLLSIIANPSDVNVQTSMMLQIIHSFKPEDDLSTVIKAFVDTFDKVPYLLENEEISAFFKSRILLPIIESTCIAKLDIHHQPVIQLQLLELVASMKGEQLNHFMLYNNGFFVQLLALSLPTQTKAIELYWHYMNLPQLQAYQQETFIDSLDDVNNIEEESLAFVFFNIDTDGATDALIVSQKMINAMLQPDPNHDWSDIYYFKNGKKIDITDMDLLAIYEQFPLFLTNYVYLKKQSSFSKLLEAINLNFTNPNKDDHTVAKDYTDLFTNAINYKNSNVKLTGDEDQLALKEIFNPLLRIDEGIVLDLTDEHYQQICSIYWLSRKSSTIQAKTLVCLAAVFVTYSSSYIFGEEAESPNALRNYAVGLLKRAYGLDPQVFVDNDGKDHLNDWITRLLGTERAFQCTAVLKRIMIAHATQKGFGHIMGVIKPPAW